MANFFLVDHSLIQVGGHHFDYMRQVARAVDSLGFSPIVATHQDFQCPDSLGHLAPVWPTFRNTTYSKHSLLAGLREITRSAPPAATVQAGVLGGITSWRGKQRRRRTLKCRSQIIKQYAEDCHRFFSPIIFQDGDQALFVTMSELDFMGLAAYLSNHPRSLQVTWHVQFHFNLLAGRPPEYDSQKELERSILDCFQSALSRVPYHDIKCYTTSEELADQYNRLKLIRFDCLPYPVNPQLFEPPLRIPAKRCLEITVAGSVRREKGQKSYLSQLISQLWEEHLSRGTLRLNLQCNRRNRRQRNSLVPPAIQAASSAEQMDQAIQIHDHPLNECEYLKLIDRTDIGLLYYDSRRYYSRRAGILGEFLAAGKPVLVPAGSWLSAQIDECAYQHVENVIGEHESHRQFGIAETRWSRTNVPLPRNIISFDRQRNPFLCSWPISTDENALAIEFQWHWPATVGEYCRLQLTCLDDGGKPLVQQSRILGVRRNGGKSQTLFNLPGRTRQIQLEFNNAYLDSSISLTDVIFRMFGTNPLASLPTSAVGIIVPDAAQLSDAIEEMVTHYDHYLVSAVDFAQTWSVIHDPTRTIDCLIEHPMDERRVA